MIATEEDRLGINRIVRAQPLDDLGGRRSAVDQVAKKYDEVARWTPPRNVAFNLAEQLFQQVEPAMDVADRIDPVPGRNARLPRCSSLWK